MVDSSHKTRNLCHYFNPNHSAGLMEIYSRPNLSYFILKKSTTATQFSISSSSFTDSVESRCKEHFFCHLQAMNDYKAEWEHVLNAFVPIIIIHLR